MTKETKTNIAKQSDLIMDLNNLEGFDAQELIKPIVIHLIQGSHPLKKEIKCSDGDLVANEKILQQPLEIILLKTEKLFDEFENKLDANGKIDKFANYLGTLNNASAVDLGIMHKQQNLYETVNQDRLFKMKKVLLLSVNGVPYKLVMNTPAKIGAANSMVQKIVQTMKEQNTPTSLGLVFGLKSIQKENKAVGAIYYSYDIDFVRKSSDSEIKQGLELMQITQQEQIENELSEFEF